MSLHVTIGAEDVTVALSDLREVVADAVARTQAMHATVNAVEARIVTLASDVAELRRLVDTLKEGGG